MSQTVTNTPPDMLQIPTTPELKQQFEQLAGRLQLSPSALLMYLLSRATLPAEEAARFDRHVKEVFGKNGDLMRRLAK